MMSAPSGFAWGHCSKSPGLLFFQDLAKALHLFYAQGGDVYVRLTIVNAVVDHFPVTRQVQSSLLFFHQFLFSF